MNTEKDEAIPEGEEPASVSVKVSITPEEYQDLMNRAAKADEYLSLAKYTKADFINYQDRVRRDKEDWNRQALLSFVTDLLPALDGMSFAKFEDPKLTEAAQMLEREFIRVLAKYGIVPIETAGQAFDPLIHEAVAAEQGGTILEEVRRGWLIQGKVLRAASVRIVKPPEVY